MRDRRSSNSSIMRYARGELPPRVDRREKPSERPGLAVRLNLSEAQEQCLIKAAKSARVTVPKFVGDLLRDHLTQGEPHATDN